MVDWNGGSVNLPYNQNAGSIARQSVVIAAYVFKSAIFGSDRSNDYVVLLTFVNCTAHETSLLVEG